MQRVRARFLATPERPHVRFNMHDVARVFQGLLHANAEAFATVEDTLVLWKHELQRAVLDKLPSQDECLAAWEVQLVLCVHVHVVAVHLHVHEKCHSRASCPCLRT